MLGLHSVTAQKKLRSVRTAQLFNPFLLWAQNFYGMKYRGRFSHQSLEILNGSRTSPQSHNISNFDGHEILLHKSYAALSVLQQEFLKIVFMSIASEGNLKCDARYLVH